jgi:hypothetical protein
MENDQAKLLLRNAIRFHLAAKRICTGIDYPETPFFACIGYAFELSFKAYILKHGGTEEECRRLGHDLQAAMTAACDRGLQKPSPDATTLLDRIGYYHRDHSFLYIEPIDLPNVTDTLDTTNRFFKCIAEQLSELLPTGEAAPAPALDRALRRTVRLILGDDAQPTSMSTAEICNISRVVERDRAKARADLEKTQTDRATARTPEEKIKAAREFVWKVGQAALEISAATRDYHAWCKREDWSEWNDIGVSEIVEQSDRYVSSTGFCWRDRAWLFTTEKRGRGELSTEYIGTFRLTVDGELVMEFSADKSYGEDEWICKGYVDALTVGPWADALIEMWAELKLAQLRRIAKLEGTRLEKQASRLKLS